jgi:hypothetical protein
MTQPVIVTSEGFKDQLGETPLLLAIGGHFEIARILLERAVDVNSHTNTGATPLMRAQPEDLVKGNSSGGVWLDIVDIREILVRPDFDLTGNNGQLTGKTSFGGSGLTLLTLVRTVRKSAHTSCTLYDLMPCGLSGRKRVAARRTRTY